MDDNKLNTDVIYEVIKKRLYLEYEPGQVLNEIEVADELEGYFNYIMLNF